MLSFFWLKKVNFTKLKYTYHTQRNKLSLSHQCQLLFCWSEQHENCYLAVKKLINAINREKVPLLHKTYVLFICITCSLQKVCHSLGQTNIWYQPLWETVLAWFSIPAADIRAKVGFNPTTPQYDDGIRTDPPPSDPNMFHNNFYKFWVLKMLNLCYFTADLALDNWLQI